MKAKSLIRRIVAPLVAKAAEGEYRPGPYYLPVTGGWLSAQAGNYWNFWQLGYDVTGGVSRSAVVEACISAYAQTIAMLPGDHWRANDKGGRDRITNSALSRILRYPNTYQTISDFMLNLVRCLYSDGNAYALALRNDRYEIDSLHLMNPRESAPQLAQQTGDVFYRLAGNDVIERRITGPLVVPQRDVLHVRLHADRRYPWPLVGETPLAAAMGDIAVGDAMMQQQLQFYQNQARPSAVLSTDLVLDKDQVQALRDRWDEQVKGLGAGGTPILTAGLKVQPWGIPPKDSMLAEAAKISDQRIALAYRVPLQVLGIGGTPYSSTELMMQSWIATGLGFALNQVEEAIGFLFDLDGQPDEYVEFDTAALLRSAFKDRIESLARAVQGGILSPNEARNSESFDKVKFGDEPRVQQQVVPLSAAGAIPAAPGPGAPPPAGAAEAPKVKPPGAAQDGAPTKPKELTNDDIKRAARGITAAAARIGRRLN